MKKIRYAILLTLLLALALPATALAKGQPEDKIVFGGTYTLGSGETLAGNLIIFGGTATLEEASRVQGEVVTFGGSLEANGEITGNVVGVGGLIELGETAVVEQNVLTLGSTLDRAGGAIVRGEVSSGFTGPFQFDFPGGTSIPQTQVRVNPFVSLMWFLLRTLLWAAVAVVLVLFLPRQIETIGRAAVGQPLIAGGLGLLTVVIAPLVLLLLLITLLLSPLALLGFLLLAIAWGFGLVALGLELGKRLAEMAKGDWAPALSAGLGTLLLILVLNGLKAIIPCVGWLFPAAAGMVGLGAVMLTRFGTEIYPTRPPAPRAAAPFPTVPPTPEIPPAPEDVWDLPPAVDEPGLGEAPQEDLPHSG